jgi:hypothetical protein
MCTYAFNFLGFLLLVNFEERILWLLPEKGEFWRFTENCPHETEAQGRPRKVAIQDENRSQRRRIFTNVSVISS